MKQNKLKVVVGNVTYVELVAPNGRVLLTSQYYSDRRSADKIVDILENLNYEIVVEKLD